MRPSSRTGSKPSMAAPTATLLLSGLLLGVIPALAQSDAVALGVKRSSGDIDVMGSKFRPVGLDYIQEAGYPQSTRLRIGYSDDALGISFECEDTQLSAATSEDMADLSREDVVIVRVWPPGSDRYFQLYASPLESKTAHWISESGEERTKPEGFEEIRIATRVIGEGSFGTPGTPNQQNIEGWSEMISIPFSVLGVDPPQPGDRWRANFTRLDYDSGTAAIWQWREEPGEIEFQ